MGLMFKPGHQQPLHDGSTQQPDLSPLPVMVREQIDASKKWFDDQGQNATLAAQAIISRRAGQIHQFYQAQRMSRDISGLAISRTRLDLGDLQLAYEVNNGQSILTVTVFPENTKSQPKPLGDIDLNLDGYFVWVQCEPNYPDLTGSGTSVTPNTPGPYDIYLNEYLVMENVVITQACTAFVVMFGDTALRVPSLIDPPDDSSENNPLASQANGGLVPGVLPLRKKIDISTAPDGVSLPAHNDLFGYWVFDWDNILNQGSLVATGPSFVRWSAQGFPPPAVVKGIQFADPQKSPLISGGINNLSVTLSPLPKGISEFEIIIQKVVYAEFYDRGSTRTAQSSWSKSDIPSVIVNDKPLQFCSSAPGGGDFLDSNGIGIRVDLTPNLKPSDRDDNLVTVSDGPQIGFGLDGVSPDQIAANNAYKVQVQDISDAYYASIGAEITAAKALVDTTRATYLNGVTVFEAIDGSTDVQVPGGVLLTTRLNAGYVFTNTAEISGLNVREFVLADIQVLNSGRMMVDWFDLTALTNAAITIADAGQPYLDASNALINLQVTPPPTLPPRPASAGKKLNDFVYRLFTVTGDQWEFGKWQNAK